MDGKPHVNCNIPIWNRLLLRILSQLKLIFSLYETYDQSIQTTNIHHELKDRLYEELDYERESRHCGLYNFMLREENRFMFRKSFPNFQPKLLTATWLDGAQILDFKSASG